MGETDKDNNVQCGAGSPPGGDAVYGMGVIGAGVYFWRHADSRGERAVGLLKALVWPAFLVYQAFSVLGGKRRVAGTSRRG